MRALPVIGALLLLSAAGRGAPKSGGAEESAPPLLSIGLPAAELAKVVPEAAPSLRDQLLHRTGRLFGLDGEWHYQLQAGRLNWYAWEAYVDVNRASFERALRVARALIGDYERRYGKPAEHRDRGARFVATPVGVAEIAFAHWKTRTFNLDVALYAIGTLQAGRHYVVGMEVHSPRFRTR